MTANQLKKIITKLDISQAEFGRICGVTPTTTSNWMSGRKNISKPVQKIALVLNDTPELLQFFQKFKD